MKTFLKFLGVTVVAATMAFAVACGSSDNGGDTTVTDGGGTDGICTPVCDPAWECGDDGCGGTCGTCAAGKACKSNKCEDCTPACDGLVCGDDGCGGTCGDCKADEQCAADQKSCECAPQCDGKVCGDDGCGGTCGDCKAGEKCAADQSKCEACTPDCTDKVCGDDGCGGTCGDCTASGKLATCSADQSACECTPDCTDKVCGDDGCAGETCGTCGVDDTCFEGACVGPCDLPTTWDPTGVLTTLQTPGAADFGAICPDVSGDGKGDNGLSALASMINPELTKAFEGGDLGVLFEFLGVLNDASDFELVGLVGEPETTGGTEFLIETAAYDPTCMPLISFPNSSITNDELAAGPSVFTLDLAALGVDEVPLVLSIGDTQISGTVGATGADGVVVTNGVLAGILTKELVDEALAVAQEACNVPEPASFCTYLKVADQFLPLLFDLDTDKDGTKDAASVCFQFELGKATIKGFKPEPPPGG